MTGFFKLVEQYRCVDQYWSSTHCTLHYLEQQQRLGRWTWQQ
jgi:hypothetical protein